MRPPICAICGIDFRDTDEVGLVYFKKRDSDIEWDERMEQEPGSTGHPPYADWFCSKHYPAAKKLEHFTIDQALAILNTNSS
jgi:hypothetical protein